MALPGRKVAVYVQAPLDTDDTDVTVRIYRDGGSTPIATAPVHALFWKDPVVSFIDTACHSAAPTPIPPTRSRRTGQRQPAVARPAAGDRGERREQCIRGRGRLRQPEHLLALGETAGPVAADSGSTQDAGVSQGAVTLRPGRRR